MNKYLAKIIANDQEGLQMISACISGSKTKVDNIKYLSSSKVFLVSVERTKKKKHSRAQESFFAIFEPSFV